MRELYLDDMYEWMEMTGIRMIEIHSPCIDNMRMNLFYWINAIDKIDISVC